MRNLIINNSYSHSSISFAGDIDNMYLLSIKDRKGRLLFKQAVVTDDTSTTVRVPTEAFKPGIYCLIIRSARAIYNFRIFIGKLTHKKK